MRTGTYHFADGCTYQGQYADGKRNGRGVYRYAEGDVYSGEWRDDRRHGKGTVRCCSSFWEITRRAWLACAVIGALAQ